MVELARDAQIKAAECGDWTPPPELQAHLLSLMQTGRLQEQHSLLAKLIENDVIPRLLLANRPELAIASPPADEMAARLAQRVGEFSELVVKQDETAVIAYVDKLRDEGVSIESLFQDLLAPTARRLGELWTEDINDFFDVTRGIGQLQNIVRNFGQEFSEENKHPLSNRRALLMPLPGEQHTFGISLLREHLLREGWRVWCGPCQSFDEIAKLVHTQWFDTVGLSASAVGDPSLFAAEIARIRSASKNAGVRVMVGGYAFNTTPELVSAVGADATATDARQAINEILRPIPQRIE